MGKGGEEEMGRKRSALREVDVNKGTQGQDQKGIKRKRRRKPRMFKAKSFLPEGGHLQERLQMLLDPAARERAAAAIGLDEREMRTFLANQREYAVSENEKEDPDATSNEDSFPAKEDLEDLYGDNGIWPLDSSKNMFSQSQGSTDGIEILLRASQE